MLRKPCLALIVLLIAAMVSQDFVPLLHAQVAEANPLPTAQQLDQLLAPIALYPDALLAQITLPARIRRKFWMWTTGFSKIPTLAARR